MKKNNISVIINTLNESKNIRNCLESVKWADEIVLVDMYSDDNTIEIAREYTDKIFFHKRIGYADPARQFALEQVSNEWVLMIDADEMVTRELANKLLSISLEGRLDAIWVPRENYFFGKKIINTGWGALKDKQMRFFRKNAIRYTEKIHDFVNIEKNAIVYTISDPSYSIIHFNYVDIEHFIDKLNRYTTIEAKHKYNSNVRESLLKSLIGMVFEFIKRYFLYKGYKDGFEGFYLSLFMSFYKLASDAKFHLMKKYNVENTKDAISTEYNKKAAEIIDKYKNTMK